MTSRSVLLIFFVISAAAPAGGQVSVPTPPADAVNLTGMTTPVEVRFSDGRILGASGFFYMEFGPDDPTIKGPHWRGISRIYVVTAKHVVQPKRLKDLVSFTYAVRSQNGNEIDWHRVALDSKEVGERLHLCSKEDVDVAVIDVTDKLTTELMKPLEKGSQLLAFNGASSDRFPGKLPIETQPGDDVLVIGYPLGFYDQFNKLPVIKTGVLSTPMGLHFDGKDAFLLDFKYYEGSSGSLIISKPTHIGFDKGALQYSADRQYVFLGVYQGESYRNEEEPVRADLGLGWYYYNVEEAIKNPSLVH